MPSANPIFHWQTVAQLLDSAFAMYRAQAGSLLRQLALLLGSIALLKLLATAGQAGRWDALSPLQSRVLLDAGALLAAGVPPGEVFADYGGPIIYHIIIWVLLVNMLLPVLNRDPAVAEAPPFASVSALGALVAVPVGMFTIAWADLLRDLALVLGAALSNRLQLAALVEPILITHAPNLGLSLFALVLVTPFLLAAPVAYVERLPIIACLGRSIALTRGSFGRVLWLAFIVSLVSGVFVAAPATALALINDPLGGTVALALPGIVVSLLGQVAEALVVPFQLGALLTLYRDRRMWLEGADLSVRAGFAPQ